MAVPRISQPTESLLPTNSSNAAVALFRSRPFHRHPKASLMVLTLLANQDGTLDVEELRPGGDASTNADWLPYNTAAQQVAVTAGEPARFRLQGAPEIVRLVYTPVAAAVVSRCHGAYSGMGA